MNSLRRRPALGVLIAFLPGMAVGFSLPEAYALRLLPVVLVLLAIGIGVATRWRYARLPLIWLASFGLGCLVAAHALRQTQLAGTIKNSSFSAVAIEEARHTEQFVRVTVRSSSGRIVVLYLPQSGAVPQIGDTLCVTNATITPTALKTQSEYRRFLLSKGACGVSYPKEVYIKRCEGFSLRRYALSVRDRLLARLDAVGLDNESTALVGALCLGYRNEAGEISGLFRRVGAAHIMAVSGFHLGIAVSVVWLLLSGFVRTRRARRMLSVAILAAAWLFALLTGLSAPTLRAAFMLTLFEASSFLGIARDRFNIIAFSALVLLLLRPGYFFDIGFQLSYTAILSIALFYPLFYPLGGAPRKSNPLVSYLYGLVALSLSAQVLTTPLVLYHFGTTSLWTLWSNVPLVILSSVLIPVGLFVLIAVPYALLPHFGTIIGLLCHGMLRTAGFFMELGEGMLHLRLSLGGLIACWLLGAALYPFARHLRKQFAAYREVYGAENALNRIRIPQSVIGKAEKKRGKRRLDDLLP